MKTKLPRVILTLTLLIFLNAQLAVLFAQGTYAKLEAVFSITNLASDPFDYTATDVRAQLARPDQSTISLPAFFDGGTTWRARYTPTNRGVFSLTGVTLNGAPITVGLLSPATWTVAGPPTDAGFVRVDPSNPRRFITSDGRRFFPLGENAAWDIGDHSVTNILWRMGAAHENWSRVWMDFWDNKDLDWPHYGPTLPLGQLNLKVAQKWDVIVAAAEQAGIRFQMTLQNPGQYSTILTPNWAENPYDITNIIGSTNGFMLNPVEFFTNATAISLTERKLRYAVARWGYSPAVMAWELFNEVQYTDAGLAGQWSLIQSWHDQMAVFLRSQDPFQHLITTSSDLAKPIWDQCDYYTHHDYPRDVISGLRDATDIGPLQPVRPDFGAECGINGTPKYGVNAPIWAGLMNGQSAAEMPWWWDSMDAENDYIYFRAASDFITLSGLGDQNVLTKTMPPVNGPGPLAAYALGNTNFSATWIWSRTNVFNPAATGPVAGTVAVAGLNPGTYAGVWWDTFAGMAISNFTFAVADTNPVTLNTPLILRSVAFYAGLPPQARVAATNLTQTLGSNSPALTVPLVISNPGGLPLACSLELTQLTSIAYTPLDSTQPGGPVFAWKDFSALGADLTGLFTALAPPKTAGDEGIAGPINIGFAFPFFTNTFTQLYVSPNGFVTFSPFSGDISTNLPLPNPSAPSEMIAFFWEDLDLTASGHVYACTDALNGTFTLQFQNVPFKGGPANLNVNCELVLKPTGEILMQYQAMAFSNTCTVGLQNAARNQGTTLAFNQNYLRPNFAVRFEPLPWLELDAAAAIVPGANSNTVNITFNPSGLGYGNYFATLLLQTTAPDQPQMALPLALGITPLATWRQTHFGTAQNSGPAANTADPDGDGLINILEYAFNTDPNVANPNPVTFAVTNQFLTLTFPRTHPPPADLTYIPEVSANLAAGVWNSGPAYTTQTVTDLAPLNSTLKHFLRIRIVLQ